MKVEGKKKSVRYVVYGAFAGAVARTTVAPLERIKILQQVKGIHPTGSDAVRATQWFRFLVRTEEWPSLWKGNLASLVKIVPIYSLRYFSFDFYSVLLNNFFPKSKNEPLRTAFHIALCGAAAGMTGLVCTYPIDMVRLRWTTYTKFNLENDTIKGEQRYQGLRSTAKLILKEEGFLSFYKGMGTAAFGTVPYVAANFCIFESLRQWRGTPTGVEAALMGGFSGAAAMTFSFPFDFLHKRLVIDGARGKERKYASLPNAIKVIYAKEGYRGFLQGLPISYVKVIPAQAVAWSVIEFCRRVWG